MSLQPKELLELAKRLLSDNEVDNRSAASRAYYAAYHCCKPISDALPDPPSHVKVGGSHDRLIQAMQHCPPRDSTSGVHKRIRKIGVRMGMLRTIRVDADYTLAAPFDRGLAESAIKDAEWVMAEVDEISTSSAP